MRKILCISFILAMSFSILSCGPSKGSKGAFAGSFTDEFGNKFTLNEDSTAVIQFVGSEKVFNTSWSEDSVYATIEYNGDPTYYYLFNGALYRNKEQMNAGRAAIKVKYE